MPLFAAILRIPFSIIAPVIVVICAIGAYTVQQRDARHLVHAGFGVIGYVFKKLDYPLAPMVLALVLGDNAENSFRQSMLDSRRQCLDHVVEPAGRQASRRLRSSCCCGHCSPSSWPTSAGRRQAPARGPERPVIPAGDDDDRHRDDPGNGNPRQGCRDGVAQVLGLTLVRHEIGDEVADRLRINRSLIRRAREGQAGWLEKRSYDDRSFALYGAEQVFEYALRDNVLIRGWGATSLLKGIAGIPCVRVCAPIASRVRWLMERLDTDDEELARDEIERSDRAHASRIRQNFGIDWHDPLEYHLVVNTGRISVAGCVEQVVHLSRLPELAWSEASAEALRNRALAARIRAAFTANSASADINVAIDVDDRVVVLRGMVASDDERRVAEDIATGVDGVSAVDNQLRVIRGTKVYPLPR